MSSVPTPPVNPSNQILEYLTRHGHTRAAAALAAELAENAAIASGGGKAVGLDEFANRNAPKSGSGSGAGAGAAAGAGATAMQPQASGPGVVKRRPLDQAVAAGQMLADPPSWEKGYEGLRSFVENVGVWAAS